MERVGVATLSGALSLPTCGEPVGLMDTKRAHVSILLFATVILIPLNASSAKPLENPTFVRGIENITVVLGREAILECVVTDLGVYKVAWLRVDTQTILTIHNHLITKNQRIGVRHSEDKTWYLHIKQVKESDRGWYMCQINTDPMKSQVGFLDVVVPPDIVDYRTSADMIVQEGSNVSLRCTARGSPQPSIIWKREFGDTIHQNGGQEITGDASSTLSISSVNRKQMGPYLCIASNGIPPSVSKRIMLVVQFPPMIWIQYQLIGAYDGQVIVLECSSEAFPKSINYWTRNKGEIVPTNEKYDPQLVYDQYKVHMKLTIRSLEARDYGIYKCISKNVLGETDGTINVYRIPKPVVSGKMSSMQQRKKLNNKSPMNELTQWSASKNDDDHQANSLSLEENKPSSSDTFSFKLHLFVSLFTHLLPFIGYSLG